MKLLNVLFYVESKIVEYIEAESRTVVTRGKEVGEVGRCWSKGTRLQLRRMNNYRDLMYSMRTVANSTVLNTGNC